MKPLKILLGTLAVIIITCSFLLDSGEDDFSPARESKENINKSTHFTKLTKFVRNIYALLIVVFVLLAFLLAKLSRPN